MKENSILKIKVLSYRKGNGGYISFDDTLKDYWESSSTISDLLDRFVFIDVMYVPFKSILFFSGQKNLFFLRGSESFYYFEMFLTDGKKYFIPGKPEEVLPTLFFNDFIIKD